MSHAINEVQSISTHKVFNPGLIESLRFEGLSHEELVSLNLLEILEEKYEELDKKTRDAIIMLLIENGIELEL